MNRETLWVTVILLLSGVAFLGLAILFLLTAILIELEHDPRGPVRWDIAATYIIPPAVLGTFLVSLGVITLRRRRASR